MASEKQIEANRKNSKKSTGPKSDEGKAVTRLNGLEHGLRTRCVDVLPGEDHEEFATRLRKWLYDYKPTSDLERFLVRQGVVTTWKIERADRCEQARLAALIDEAVEPWMYGPDSVGIAEASQDAASFDASPEGERIRRYQFSLHRALDRILARLAKIREDEDAGFWEPAGKFDMQTAEVVYEEELAESDDPTDEADDPEDEDSDFSTTEANFEEFLQESAPTKSTTEANLAPVAPVAFHVVPNRPFDSGAKSSLTDTDSFEWLDISCLKS
jgi:hypothetical protein